MALAELLGRFVAGLTTSGYERVEIGYAGGLAERDPMRAGEELDNEELCPPDRRDFVWRHLRYTCRRLLVRQGRSNYLPDHHLQCIQRYCCCCSNRSARSTSRRRSWDWSPHPS